MVSEIIRNRPKVRIDKILNDYKTIFIFLIIFIVLSFVSEYFFTSRNLMNVLRQICTSATLGIGFTLIIASGNIDLSVGTLVGMLGAFTAMMSKIEGMPPVIVILLGITFGVMCGLINGIITNFLEIPSFIITLAMMSIFKGACYLMTKNAAVTGIPDWYKFIGQGYIGPIPVPVIILFIMIIIGTTILNKTVFGRNALAMGGNSEAARVCGINIGRVRLGVFAFMGACATITAMLLTGRAASAQTTAGQGMEMDAIAAVIIGGTALTGGKGSVIGTIFGCLIVGTINNGLNLLNVNSNWQLVAKGLLILIAISIDAQSTKLGQRMLKQKV